MTDRRYFVQILERQNGELLALANDGTVWVWDPMFTVWEPACYDSDRKVCTCPQPGKEWM